MMATPIAWRVSEPAPTPRAIGAMPRIIAKVVIRIGRRRIGAALRSASNIGRPSSRNWLVNSTSRMAFLVTRPISVMMPMIEMIESVCLASNRANSAPTMASGSESMMVKGWMKLSNCAASTM
ncbi:hypothetical protein D3C72_362560 [compost metagenome]